MPDPGKLGLRDLSIIVAHPLDQHGSMLVRSLQRRHRVSRRLLRNRTSTTGYSEPPISIDTES